MKRIADKTRAATYEPRILLLLDLLGFGALVSDPKVAAPRVRELFDLFKVIGQLLSKKGQMKTMKVNFAEWHFHIVSDTMTISCPFSSHDQFNVLSASAMHYQAKMLVRYGIPVRGAMVYGDIYDVEPEIIFGPALLRAQKLEKREAKWSRILVDRTVIDRIGARQLARDVTDFLTKDDGEFYYLDYLSDLFHVAANRNDASGMIHEVNAPLELFKVHKQAIEKAIRSVLGRLDDKEKPEILNKYKNLGTYHNGIINKHRSMIDSVLLRDKFLAQITEDAVQLQSNPEHVSKDMAQDSRHWGIAWLVAHDLEKSTITIPDSSRRAIDRVTRVRMSLAVIKDELQQCLIEPGLLTRPGA